MAAPPGLCPSFWGGAWSPRTAAGKAPGSAVTDESPGPMLACPPRRCWMRTRGGITQPGFNFTKEIPPPGSLPTSPQLFVQELSPRRHTHLLAVPADAENQAWLPAGRQWVWRMGLVPDTPCQRSQLCILFSRSTNFYGVSVQGQSPGPFVLAVRKSESDEVCLKSPTPSKRSCVYPSPLSTYCVLGTRHSPVWPARETGPHQDTRVRKGLARRWNQLMPMGLVLSRVILVGPPPFLLHRVAREDHYSLYPRVGTRFNISHIQGEGAITEHLPSQLPSLGDQSMCSFNRHLLRPTRDQGLGTEQ